MVFDSNISFAESIHGKEIPDNVLSELELVDVKYYSFDGLAHTGQILIHKKLATEIRDIFKVIYESRFPVNKVVPISKYQWSDSISMSDNNSSCFNYRYVRGTTMLSPHSYGMAIDINPMQNPLRRGGRNFPFTGNYNPAERGTLTDTSAVVLEFKKRGWRWGGDWLRSKDYQHFEKRI